MKLIPAFGLLATLLMPRAVEAQGTPAAPVAPPCEAQSQRLAESIRGNVKRGDTFRQLTPSNWIFALNPSPEGWWLSVTTRGREDENLARLTPPWHGANARYLDGWNFRNADNTGPNDGSVNAPGELREFIFSPAVGRELEYRGSGTTSDDVATVRAFGRGWLFVESYQLTPPQRGGRASFESLTFRACLTWPAAGAQDQLDPRIGPAVASKFVGIRDAADWLNPYLSVCPQGVILRVRSMARETRTIQIADLRRTLLDLPVEAWPYGRVVGLQNCSLSGGASDEAAREQRLRDVQSVLKILQLRIELWPS